MKKVYVCDVCGYEYDGDAPCAAWARISSPCARNKPQSEWASAPQVWRSRRPFFLRFGRAEQAVGAQKRGV